MGATLDHMELIGGDIINFCMVGRPSIKAIYMEYDNNGDEEESDEFMGESDDPLCFVVMPLSSNL